MNIEHIITTSELKVTTVENGFVLARDGEAIFAPKYLIDDLIRSLDEYDDLIKEALEDDYAFSSEVETIDFLQVAPTAFGVIIVDDREGLIVLAGEVEKLIEVLKSN